MRPDILAIDLGTSNSAAAILENGVPCRLPIQPGSDTLQRCSSPPRAARCGSAMRPGAALIARKPGRYMRALKSVLGGQLLRESRMIGGRRQTLADVIAAFLRALRERAEAATGVQYRRALSGRPVHFHRRSGPRRPCGGRSQGPLSRRGLQGDSVPLRARGRSARMSDARDKRRRRPGRLHRRRHLVFHRLRRRGR